MHRSSQEYMILILCFGGAVAIFPFAYIRFQQGEWLVGFVDSVMILGMLALGTYTYLFHTVKYAACGLSVFALAGMTTVIYLKGASLVYWAYPTMVGVYFIVQPRLAISLTLATAVILVPPIFSHLPFNQFIAVFMTLVVNNVFAYMFAVRMHDQSDQLKELVRIDSLTGANNRLALDEKIDELIQLNQRNQQVFAVVIIDADKFKLINDDYGHAMGDQVLIKMVNLLKTRIRVTDNLYRYGGEEFVIVLLGAKLNDAKNIAEEFRQSIEKGRILQNRSVTISLGVAEYLSGESAEECFERADKALYRAKDQGRNQVCLAE